MKNYRTNEVVSFLVKKGEYGLAKTINIICKEKTVGEKLLKSYCGTLLYSHINRSLISV